MSNTFIQPLNESELLAQEFQRDPPARLSSEARRNRTNLHQIKLIENYYKVNKPLLSKARRDMIEEKLELEKMALKQAKERTKVDDLMVRYHFNPFTEKENMRMNRTLSQKAMKDSLSKGKRLNMKGDTFQQRNIVDAIHSISSRKFPKQTEEFYEIRRDALQQSSKFLQHAKKSHLNQSKKESNVKEAAVAASQLSFDDIIKIQEKSYYSEKQGEINIFQLMNGNTRRLLTKDILPDHYFSFTSNVDKLSKFKFPIQRDLSKQARCFAFMYNIARSVRLDALNSKELTFNTKDIRFIDLIGVASGRLDPPLVYSILYEGNAQKDNSPSSSVYDEEAIIYADHERQTMMNFDHQQHIKQENVDYLKLQDNQLQVNYYKKYHKVYKNAEVNVEQVNKILRSTIKDKKLHNCYQTLIANDLEYLISLDKRKVADIAEPDKLIRYNKKNKNRQERLKIKELLSTVRLKNQYQEKMEKLLGGTTKIK